MKANLGSVALLAAALALACPAQAGQNDPFGPEMACFAGITKPIGAVALQKNRTPGHVTQNALPVVVYDTNGHFISIETQSEDGKSTHLHMFSETGEFEADVPLVTNATTICIEGVGFPTGVGSVLYRNVVTQYPTGRFGSQTNYRKNICNEGKDRPEPIKAHQVGAKAQTASRARLHSELALMIGNVHSSWQERLNTVARMGELRFDERRSYERGLKVPPIETSKQSYDANVGALSDEAQKRGLRKCLEVLQGDSYKDLRAAAERELGLFESKAVEGAQPDPAQAAQKPK